LCVRRTASDAGLSGSRRAALGRIDRADRSEDERRLEDERLARTRRIPADDVAHALESVSDRVGVYEELAGGRLERTSVVKIGPEGRDEIGRVRLQGTVDAIDQGVLRKHVARERA